MIRGANRALGKALGLALAAAVIVAAACGTDPGRPPAGGGSESPTPEPSEQKYRGTGTVLEERRSAPVLCLGAVMDSLPPQCGGIPIEGWDWDAVAGEESAAGTTWGHFEVTGFYDGDTFILLEARPPGPPPVEGDPITSECPEPAGGWEVPDPGRSGSADWERAIAAARRQPDFAGAWIDYLEEPREFDEDTAIVLNLAFTGDLAKHEPEVREDWGGPLCLVLHRHALKDLLEIQRDFPAGEFGLEQLWSSASETENVVEIGVVVASEAAERKIAERYGAGTVRLVPQLHPVP